MDSTPPPAEIGLKVLFSSFNFLGKLFTSSDEKQSLKFKYSTALKLGEQEGSTKKSQKLSFVFTTFIKSLNIFCGELLICCNYVPPRPGHLWDKFSKFGKGGPSGQ